MHQAALHAFEVDGTRGRLGQALEQAACRRVVYPIHLPPLRERREDVPLLLSHFPHVYSRLLGRKLLGYAPRAVRALMAYGFPGNIRELQNMVERGVISADEYLGLAHGFIGQGAVVKAARAAQRQFGQALRDTLQQQPRC
jgi:transcriptional regulator with AAA-type ATPase domain